MSDAPQLAQALMFLRGETIADLARSTGIKSANLSIWLRGTGKVISEARVVVLLDHLGVRGGQLRTDVIHKWHDRGAFENTKLVLNMLVSSVDRPHVMLYLNRQNFFETWALLEITPELNSAFVALRSTPSLSEGNTISAKALEVSDSFIIPDDIEQLIKIPIEELRRYTVDIRGNSIGAASHKADDAGASEIPLSGRPSEYLITHNQRELQHAIDRATSRGISSQHIIDVINALRHIGDI